MAREALLAALDDGWADPTRQYRRARQARQLFDAARAVVADALRVAPEAVRFTSSGSAAAQLALTGILDDSTGTLVHSAVEHSAVLHAAEEHEQRGGVARSVAVDGCGTVDLYEFADAISQPGVALAALQAANHEVGTVQPIEAVSALCRTAGVPLYVDAAAALGHVTIADGWSALTASARKWGGPAGVGVLAVAPEAHQLPAVTRLVDRSPPDGAVNLPTIVAAAAALRARLASRRGDAARLAALVDRVRAEIIRLVPDTVVVGHPTERLPHIVTFSCLYVPGEALVTALDAHGFAVSSGSACTSDTLQPSHVLAAMGAITHGNIRVSVHPEVRDSDVTQFLAVLPGLVAELRR